MSGDLADSSSFEPWLRGIVPGIDPVIGHLLRASQHVREDMERTLSAVSSEAIWHAPDGVTPVGFHAKHIAGSTRRLCTYLAGEQLTAAQMAEMGNEGNGTETGPELLANLNVSMDEYDARLRSLNPTEFGAVREIGRMRLQTTAISLAIHIAEHSMRHVGLAIAASKLARTS